MPESLADDPRWVQFNNKEWVCSTCDHPHRGLFDIAVDRPIYWDGPAGPSDESTDPLNFLNSDFCILNREHFFVRCVLRLPIIGGNGLQFGYGIWSSLSKDNFELYKRTYGSGTQAELGPWFGWFSNQLAGYPQTLGLKCHLHPQDGNQRPLIELEATDHPLALEQANGVSFDRVLEIYTLNGHNFREALAERQ